MDPDERPDDDFPGSPPLLPPDDRLWRHPSELGAQARPAASPSRALWAVALAAGTAGALLTVAALGVVGVLDDDVAEGPAASAIPVAAPATTAAATFQASGSDVAGTVEGVRLSVARVVAERSGTATGGTALVVRPDGYLLTTRAAVDGAERLAVVLSDGATTPGEIVGSDADTDLAVIRVDRAHLPMAPFPEAAAVRVGDPVLAVWSPAGPAEAAAGPAVAVGVVSALGARVNDGARSLHGLIQTDAVVAAGSAGGPLLDGDGMVVGVMAERGEGHPSGLATPIDVARRVADQLVEKGSMTWGWLGIQGADLDLATAERLGTASGALVRDVVADGPAARAGLLAGDVINTVDGVEVSSMSGLVVALRHHAPGDDIEVGYVRDGERHRTAVRLIARP